MRLKTMDGPLSVHNGNNDILNSPKRINTVQNSNYTTSNLTTLNNETNNTTTIQDATSDLNTLNNVNNSQDTVQWCISSQNHHHHQQQQQQIKKRELQNNANNRNQLLNINNTLATNLRNTQRHGTASSICSESSPDDSLLDYEGHQSGSSAETSPQDEERVFDISDSESSDEGNLSNRETNSVQRRGIVNPNYPGFQHLAHTLDYTIKASSDTDYTDDDFECETNDDIIKQQQQTDVNNINNNNNNNNIEDDDTSIEQQFEQIDHIDSVNRLDSVENIQKVFYDKPVFNIEEDSDVVNSESCSNSNTSGDDDTEVHLNIKIEEQPTITTLTQSNTHENIVGDFGKEVEQELGRISLEKQSAVEEKSTAAEYESIFDKPYELPPLERALIQELKEAVEKLVVIADWQPAATRYNIQPNIEEPFNKVPDQQLEKNPTILKDSQIVNNMNQQEIKSKINLELKETSINEKISDAFLSNGQEALTTALVDDNLNVKKMDVEEMSHFDSNRELEQIETQIKKIKSDTNDLERVEKFCKEDITKEYKEKEEDCSTKRKKEKPDFYVKKRRDYNQQFGSLITFPRREMASRNRDPLNRRSVPMARDKKRASPEVLGGFDVYNIETAMPKIDLEAIETHLRAAREEERRRRTDREEIRRRLAMGSEDDYYTDRPGRKPSLQARLQSGMNLQICFMNETVSDTESPNSDTECPMTAKQPKTDTKNANIVEKIAPVRPATLSIGQPLLQPIKEPMTETDFFTRQARLQTEARMALAQAKEMARMQMEIERQRLKKSPITEMVRHSLEKVGIPFPEEKRRLSRQILTEMNVAQLQVIVNDLHTQIETLNENLVKFLMDRDDLHMEQDSMLVDIEDLTRYLGAKEQVLKEQNYMLPTQNNNIPPPSPAPSSPLAALNSSVRPHLHRIASLVKK